MPGDPEPERHMTRSTIMTLPIKGQSLLPTWPLRIWISCSSWPLESKSVSRVGLLPRTCHCSPKHGSVRGALFIGRNIRVMSCLLRQRVEATHCSAEAHVGGCGTRQVGATGVLGEIVSGKRISARAGATAEIVELTNSAFSTEPA